MRSGFQASLLSILGRLISQNATMGLGTGINARSMVNHRDSMVNHREKRTLCGLWITVVFRPSLVLKFQIKSCRMNEFVRWLKMSTSDFMSSSSVLGFGFFDVL